MNTFPQSSLFKEMPPDEGVASRQLSRDSKEKRVIDYSELTMVNSRLKIHPKGQEAANTAPVV